MAKLLIVDDDDAVCALLKTQLESDEHECVTAADARLAREQLAAGSFDLMLVDIRMPGESGLELARHTHQVYPDMAVVVVSVIGDPQEAQAALEIGVFGYIIKPFEKNQILISVKNALRRRDLEKRCSTQTAALEQAVQERSRELRELVQRLSIAKSEGEETTRRLADQVQLLQALLDAIPNPIYHKDANGIILGCNAAFAEHTNHPRQEITGRALPELAPSLAAALHDTDLQLLRAGGEHICEVPLTYPDGTTQEVLISRAAYRDAQGAVAGLVAILVDITQRRSMELKLAQSERYQRAIWNSVPSGIALVEAKTHKIVDVNPQAAKMVGLPVDRIVGRVCHGFLCPSSAGHCPITDLRKIIDGRECTLLTADGRSTPVMKAVTTIDVDGRELLIESFLDLSDRTTAERALRTSEEKTRQIMENIGIGVALISPDMRILELNRQMRQWFPTVDAATQPQCYAAYNDPPRSAPCEYCPTIKTLADGEVHEALTQTPSGETVRNFRVVASPIHDGDGHLVAAIEMVEDVTERQLLEKELRQAQKLESIGQLAAGIAHEINTPTQYVGDNTRFLQEAFGDLLGAVKALEELLAVVRQDPGREDLIRSIDAQLAKADPGYLADEVPKAIEQTLEGVDRIMRIVRSMKEFSHPGSVERIPTDINKALDTTVTVARNEWKYVADVETDFDPSLPAVCCFPGELNQVFLNILVNAAHAVGDVVNRASSEKGKIRISTRQQGDWVEVRFSDSGSGIPQSIQHCIFDPFFTTKQVGKGTGQGLAIAHRVIVEKHGGTLRFETKEGAGTTFIIGLPIEISQSAKVA
jgi:PAS domain S-box-containing protein